MIRLSVIVNVLESYEVVRRQLLHLARVLTPECELILVDDGSVPPLRPICDSVPSPDHFTLIETHDTRPWTHPRARNLGAARARADRLLFFDIDHIITRDVVAEALAYPGDKLHWVRRPAVLDADGRIVTEVEVLRTYGMTDPSPSVHANSFVIRAAVFRLLGGYDERFCGSYGGDDIDLQARYDRLCAQGLARPVEVRGAGYVYPDPARDVRKLFHALPR
jgi:predicted glycosyltransferase involved in capsule biosynthesis